MKILFVCNANIVRSFIAERVLQSRLILKGINNVEVSSAGLLDMHGAPADKTAREILQEKGIDDEDHHSRVVDERLISEADLIITMEKEQIRIIEEKYPSAKNKLRILKSFLPQSGHHDLEDIKDPYGQSAFYYRLCFAEIFLAIEELIRCI